MRNKQIDPSMIYNKMPLQNNLCIINKGKIALKGEPLRVLDKDNVLNKIGLEVPFMIDLSVKLKDYQLVNKIILNQEEMIEELWK